MEFLCSMGYQVAFEGRGERGFVVSDWRKFFRWLRMLRVGERRRGREIAYIFPKSREEYAEFFPTRCAIDHRK
jgi:hypothetical protein